MHHNLGEEKVKLGDSDMYLGYFQVNHRVQDSHPIMGFFESQCI